MELRAGTPHRRRPRALRLRRRAWGDDHGKDDISKLLNAYARSRNDDGDKLRGRRSTKPVPCHAQTPPHCCPQGVRPYAPAEHDDVDAESCRCRGLTGRTSIGMTPRPRTLSRNKLVTMNLMQSKPSGSAIATGKWSQWQLCGQNLLLTGHHH